MICYKCEDLMGIIRQLEEEVQVLAAKLDEKTDKLVGSTWSSSPKKSEVSDRVDKIIAEGEEALLRYNEQVRMEIGREAKRQKEKTNA